MRCKIFWCILLAFCSPLLWRGMGLVPIGASGGEALAQEVLTLDKALETVLKNNYSIQVSRNQSQIAANDASAGNAGMLPQLALNASGSFASNDTRQKFNTGVEVEKEGASSTNVSAGVGFTWTLFDGMRMFAAYNRLQELSGMSQVSLKIQIENTVADVINVYYSLVKQKQLIRATENALQLYEERAKIAEKKWEIGSGSKSDYLQAKVDKNEQQSSYLSLKNSLTQMKVSLNTLLARPADTEFTVTDSIPVTYKPAYEELKTTVVKQNNQLLFQQKNVSVNEYAIREMNSFRYPRLSFSSNYNFTQSENQVGIVLLNRNLGFNAGFTASWTLFNGFNINRQVKNSRIELMNSKLLLDQTKNVVESSLLIAFNNFKNAMELLVLEEESFKLAKENVDIALERFRLGNFTSIELKTAQKSFEDAQSRLVNARYAAKADETELMRLNGMLVK